ncbi:MAG: lipase family protein [Methylovirgula sp.]
MTDFDKAVAIELAQLNSIVYDMYSKNPLTPNFPGFSGYEFVAWIQMRDFDIHSHESAYCFYGFILKKNNEANNYVLVIRGTENAEELYDDFKAATSVPFKGPSDEEHGRVAYGFDRIFETMRVIGADSKLVSSFGAKDFPAQVKAIINKHAARADPQSAQSQKSITVSGHSLGSALATLYAAKIAKDPDLNIALLCTFASPLVGDVAFADWFNGLGIQSWRIVNTMDIVTIVPLTSLGFKHVNQEYHYTPDDMKNSVDCYHRVDTYLNLLDPINFKLYWLCEKFGPNIS